MICVNADKSKMLTLKRLFESALEDVNEELANEQVEHEEPNIVENFYTTAGSMIEVRLNKKHMGKMLSDSNYQEQKKYQLYAPCIKRFL